MCSNSSYVDVPLRVPTTEGFKVETKHNFHLWTLIATWLADIHNQDLLTWTCSFILIDCKTNISLHLGAFLWIHKISSFLPYQKFPKWPVLWWLNMEWRVPRWTFLAKTQYFLLTSCPSKTVKFTHEQLSVTNVDSIACRATCPNQSTWH